MSRDSRKGGELLGGSMMDAIQYQGKVYIAEPDVRKAVNAALATNEERDRRISELEAKLATRSESAVPEQLKMHPEVVKRVLELANIPYKDFKAADIKMLMGFCALHATHTFFRQRSERPRDSQEKA